MSKELTMAAQQALEVLESLQGGCTDHDDGTVEAITVWCPEVIEALRNALTQRPAAPTLKGFTPPTAEWLAERLAISGDFDASAGAPCLKPPGCNGSNCIGCSESPAAQTERDTGPRVLREVFALCEDTVDKMTAESTEFSRGRAFEAKGIARAIGTWFQDEYCGQSHMGEPSLPTPQQATPDQFADASNMVAPVALRSVHLTRDMAGMCFVRINGRVAIRDNGDLIDHMATLEWFADTQQATPEPVGEVVYQIKGDSFECPHAWRDATEEAFYTTPAADRRILYTRPAPGVPEVDDLAQFIRQIDGKHSMGAGALAEHICDWLAAAQAKGGE